MARSTRFFLGALLLATLALRLGYLWEYRASPFFDAPVVDSQTFLKQAQALLASGPFWEGDEPYWQPPLYIYLLTFVCWLLPDSYFIGIRLVHVGFGVLSCLLVYALARHAFGEQVGRIASVMAALCGSFLYFEGELLAVPMEVFLNLLLLYGLLIAWRRDHGRYWVITGLIAGLAALTRPTILLFIAALCAWVLWHRRTSTYRSLLSFIVPIALVILPVTYRNWTIESGLVFISSNAGVNFYIGNNADYERTVSLRPGMQWETMISEAENSGHKTAAAQSAFFFGKALDYITTQPLDYLGLLGKKVFHFWSGPEIKRNQDIYYARQHSQILSLLLWDWHISIPFGLIGPLSLLGLGLSMRGKWTPPIALLRLYALVYMASVVLFFPVARYRMPVVPVLIAFAAFATFQFCLGVRHRAYIRTTVLALPLGGLLVLCNLTEAAPTEEDAQLYFDLGEVHLRKQDYALSARYSRRALELDPRYNYARHNLAVAYFHQEHYGKSEREALQTLAENPRRTDTRVLLGRIYLATNKPQQAAAHLRHILERYPESGMAHYYYGRLLYRQGHYAEAATHLQQALSWQPQDFWLHYELGRAFQQAGQAEAALGQYHQALSLARRPEALNAIGALHLLAGRTQAARTHFLQVLELDPNNPDVHVNLALIELENGNHAAAIDRLRQVLARGPFPHAQRLLDEAYRRLESP
ncbi:MAG: tetratricopeptide repeat protein [Gemmatimonadetes bacterium]|nr:tetratricopeptide repeat protein [Gemmatimonadota bacterium]